MGTRPGTGADHSFDKVKHMRWQNFLAVLFCALLVGHAPARASDVTDHWWAPLESGWGVSVTQQDDTAFIVFFVHGKNGEPTWFHGTGTRGGHDMEGNPFFSGPLYRTSGPWHGGPFDSSQAQAVQVGTVIFEANAINRAVVEYTVDGVKTTKVVQRLTFRNRDWSGVYRGVVRANYRACAPEFVPAFIYDDGLVDVEHRGSAFTMWLDGKQAACMFTGTYTQHGRVGEVQGNYTCADGPSGTFKLKDLETTRNTFGGRLETTHPSCGSVTIDVAGFGLISY